MFVFHCVPNTVTRVCQIHLHLMMSWPPSFNYTVNLTAGQAVLPALADKTFCQRHKLTLSDLLYCLWRKLDLCSVDAVADWCERLWGVLMNWLIHTAVTVFQFHHLMSHKIDASPPLFVPVRAECEVNSRPWTEQMGAVSVTSWWKNGCQDQEEGILQRCVCHESTRPSLSP